MDTCTLVSSDVLDLLALRSESCFMDPHYKLGACLFFTLGLNSLNTTRVLENS